MIKMNLGSYETYELFMALRNHFQTESYDYFLYNGKIRANRETYLKDKHRFKYAKLAREYDATELRDFMISNFLAGKTWVGQFLEDGSDDIYRAYTARKRDIQNTFSNETDALFGSVDKPEDAFKVKGGQYPPLIQLYLAGRVSIETVSILNTFLPFIPKFDEKLDKDDVIWSRIRPMVIKLTPFLDFDREFAKETLKSYIINKESPKKIVGE